jgi:uncharacterized membrane protein YphA (DoxX/SURF4 family)
MDQVAAAASVAPSRPAVAAPTLAPALLLAGRFIFAAALLGLAALGFLNGDFALQWQPVPDGLPGRTPLAYTAAAIELVLGLALLTPRILPAAAAAVSGWFLLWAAAHAPAVIATPFDLAGPTQIMKSITNAFLGISEPLETAAGALLLWAAVSPAKLSRAGVLVGRLVFGVCLPVFGISHLAYAQVTADMIPAYIPFHMFWAYFTGAAHIAAGLSILSGVLKRLGSLLFGVMTSGFVLLLHVPRVLGDPGSRMEWTMLGMSAVITAAAWCAAGAIRRAYPPTR